MRLVHLSRYLFCALFGLLFFVTTAVAQVNEIEPNNSPATAQVIVLGTEYVGKISSGTPADTGDYFRFSLTSPGNVTLRLKPQTAGGSSNSSAWRVRLWDYATGNELLGFYVGKLDPVGETTSVGLAAGNYYVSIENNGGAIDIPYLFIATYVAGNNFEQEFNDSPGSAQPITLGTEYLGRLQSRISTSVAEFDYYKFSLTSPGNMTLRLKPQTAGGSSNSSAWRVRLWDYATGNELLGFYVGKLDPVGETTSVGLAAGNYYVSIENNGGAIDIPYLFIATYVAGNNFEQEFNDSPGSAQPITLGTEYLGRLQSRISTSVAEFDYYKFSLTSPRNMTLRLKPQTAGGSSNSSAWRIRLRDYATNIVLAEFYVGKLDPVGTTSIVSLAAGSYYVSIENNGGAIDIPYIFSATPAGFVPPSVSMVEYLHVALNYYFITASPTEIAALDTVPAFVRTGESFPVYAAPYAGTHGITRFYFDRIAVNQSRGSHFYTSVDSEVAAVAALNPSNMPAPRLPVNEGVNSYAFLPVTAGVCAAGQRPVYRIFRGNARFPDDPNHRFTTSLTIYNNFVALGWDGEGVKFCVPAL